MALRSGTRWKQLSNENAPWARCTTMDRLEAKGLLKTWVGEATPQRGGRGKRMVRVTPQGVREAKEFYDSVVRISRGASWVETRMGGTS
jgi:PadR family transcriptional regulator, regulatory protein PadR